MHARQEPREKRRRARESADDARPTPLKSPRASLIRACADKRPDGTVPTLEDPPDDVYAGNPRNAQLSRCDYFPRGRASAEGKCRSSDGAMYFYECGDCYFSKTS